MKNVRSLLILAALISAVLLSACSEEHSIGVRGCDAYYEGTFENTVDASLEWVVRLEAHDAETGESLGQRSFSNSVGPLATESYSGQFHLRKAPPSGKAIIEMYVDDERWDKAVAEIDPEACWVDPEWTFSVDQLSSTRPEASVPSPAGTFACGLFDVMTLGEKVVDLSLYPECPADPTVYCMDNAGNWTSTNVADLSVSDDGILMFTSGQEGLCGLFPAP